MNHANKTLGELLSKKNNTIKRHAFGILKELVKQADKERGFKPKTYEK
jgi:hypothetical protein